MTQYLLSVCGSKDDPTPAPTDEQMQQVYAEVDTFNTELRESGSWVFAGGLHPVETATTVNATGAEPLVTDGPYSESKEFLGGFWVIKVPDLDAAIAWAKRGSAACGGSVEVRPFQDEQG